ncbi:hypothetical protein [Halobacteriovorax sp. ZH4_bin.1]|uniref:hypothetical protein n=1 Tax=unclassified Halobacteriovorax TaxID=2639665 RepID=UPI003718AB57
MKSILLSATVTLISIKAYASLPCEQLDQNLAYENTREFISIKKKITENSQLNDDIRNRIKSLIKNTRNYYFKSGCQNLRHQQLGILLELNELKKL